MAGRGLSLGYHHRLFSPGPVMEGHTVGASAAVAVVEELEESDVWGYNYNYKATESRPAEHRKPVPSPRAGPKKGGDRDRATVGVAASLPLSIPDWSKILRGEYRGHAHAHADADAGGWEEEAEEKYGTVIPPHELVWRNRGESSSFSFSFSFSVHEGIGRTLKGRDLSRLRNAIWEKTGFQD